MFSTNVDGGSWVGTHPIIEGLTVRDVVVDPNDPATVYLGTEEAGLWVTHTGGR